MAFSMHSHSGQFCPGHAADSLEDVILTAIAKGMETFALTEHMPRNSDSDLYPEEDSLAPLRPRHEAFILEALRLRPKYASKINLLIGFEAEWIRPSYAVLVNELASNPAVDFFIGSLHHVHGIPIDYDPALYVKARSVSGGTDEKLFEDYFDSQYQMLLTLKPRVVGHFDLIRLMSDLPNRDLRELRGVWERIVRNLKVIVEQGGLVEVNSSGLRKGLKEPYPSRSVCEEYLKLGGRLTFSDDSHGVKQVGTNYKKAMEYLDSLGVEVLYTLDRKDTEAGKMSASVRKVSLRTVKESFRE